MAVNCDIMGPVVVTGLLGGGSACPLHVSIPTSPASINLVRPMRVSPRSSAVQHGRSAAAGYSRPLASSVYCDQPFQPMMKSIVLPTSWIVEGKIA
jgi:hypothetical protein